MANLKLCDVAQVDALDHKVISLASAEVASRAKQGMAAEQPFFQNRFSQPLQEA